MPFANKRIHPAFIGVLDRTARVGVLMALSVAATASGAQTAPVQAPSKMPSASPTVNPAEALKPMSGPSWQELTTAQRLSLQPLAVHWNSLEAAIKRKWIVLAANYPALTPAEQGKLHSRMSEWSQLSKQERAQARLNFAESNKVSPDQKTATWEAYQALSPEEKKKLAASAPTKPSGAAGAAKPVVPQKLATVPLSGKNQVQALSSQPGHTQIDGNTLLPLPAPAVEPGPRTE